MVFRLFLLRDIGHLSICFLHADRFELLQECQSCVDRRNKQDKGLYETVKLAWSTPSNKDHEDCMKEVTTFEEAPDCLAFHVSRTRYTANGDKQGIMAKDERPVVPNLVSHYITEPHLLNSHVSEYVVLNEQDL